MNRLPAPDATRGDMRRAPAVTPSRQLPLTFVRSRPAWICLLVVGTWSCGEAVTESPDPACEPGERSAWPLDTLSEYCFFEGPLVHEQPANGVVPYTVQTPLWADQAEKGRFIVLPDGGTIDVGDDREEWEFPEGTALVKSFYFALDRRDPDGDARIIETRLLLREADGWSAHTYVFDDDAVEARRKVAGSRVDVAFTDADGQPAEQLYLVPNTNQCGNCHERDDELLPLGPFTGQMNVPGQLDDLAARGMFSRNLGDPETLDRLAQPDGDAPLTDRARDYLHAQCAHCHRAGGGGGRSGLNLLRWETEPVKYGVCKRPVAAGGGGGDLVADIVPGRPEQSIILFRMRSTDPEIKMPELPNRLPDEEGIQLVSDWIDSLSPAGCFEN